MFTSDVWVNFGLLLSSLWGCLGNPLGGTCQFFLSSECLRGKAGRSPVLAMLLLFAWILIQIYGTWRWQSNPARQLCGHPGFSRSHSIGFQESVAMFDGLSQLAYGIFVSSKPRLEEICFRNCTALRLRWLTARCNCSQHNHIDWPFKHLIRCSLDG